MPETIAERPGAAVELAEPAAASAPAARLGIPTKLAYGIGALSDSVKTFGFTTFLLFYYTTVLGLPGSLLGAAMAIGLVWDAAIDPFIGHLSDRATLRFGRRHGFMLLGGLLAGISFAAVFNPPQGLSTGWLFAWLMGTSLVLRSSNSLFMVPYYALGSEMTPYEHERTSVSGYRAAAVLAGMVATTAASFLVYLPTDTAAGFDAKFARDSYASLGVTLGAVMILTALTATFGTLSTRSRLARQAAVSHLRRGFLHTVGMALRLPPFRILLGFSCLSFIAAALNAALALHYLTYFAVLPSSGVTIYMIALYVGGLAGVAAWVRLSKSVQKHRVLGITTMVTAVVISAGYWLVGEGRPFGTGAVWVLAAGNCLAGFFNVSGAVIAPALIADISADEEAGSGTRRDGSFFGLYSLGQQLAGGIAVLLAGVLVERFAGLVPGQPQQTAETVERIAMLSNLVPAVLTFAAGALAMLYRPQRAPADADRQEP